jgi:transcriptional regulator GlxA family with amidase domain
MRTRAKRVVIVAFDELDLLDVTAPLSVLTQAGRRWNFRPFQVEIAAPVAGSVTSRNLLRDEAPLALRNVAPAEVVLIPGGYGARRLSESPECTAEIARISGGAELVAGIGWGVLLLAAAGLCGGRRVACGPDVSPLLKAAEPTAELATELEPVFDAPLLTARASGAALGLGLTIVEKTFGPKLRAMVEADLCLEATQRIEIVGSLALPKA